MANFQERLQSIYANCGDSGVRPTEVAMQLARAGIQINVPWFTYPELSPQESDVLTKIEGYHESQKSSKR